jgi:hypothetical protein
LLENDRALLDAFRRGDRAAMTKVFRHYVDDVARTIRAGVVVNVDGQRTRVGQRLPEHEVEALVQETFTKAFAPKARESYDGVRPTARGSRRSPATSSSTGRAASAATRAWSTWRPRPSSPPRARASPIPARASASTRQRPRSGHTRPSST